MSRVKHNPDRLTASQVNPPTPRYRLLDRDEVERASPSPLIEIWRRNQWLPLYCWYPTYATLRTTLSRAELARLK